MEPIFPTSYKKELTDKITISDEVKAQKPKKSELTWNQRCSTILISVIRIICLVFLIVSGFVIVSRYPLILIGFKPTEIEKMALDYSIPIFAGSTIYLLVYTAKVEELIKKILKVKEVPPLNK